MAQYYGKYLPPEIPEVKGHEPSLTSYAGVYNYNSVEFF